MNEQKTHEEYAPALLKAIVESALDAVLIIDHRGVVTGWHGRAEQIFGWSAVEAIGQTVATLIIPPDQRAAHQTALHRWQAGNGPPQNSSIVGQRVELVAQHRDGRQFPVELTVTQLTVDGRPWFAGTVRDISERQAAEDALRASEERYRTLVDQATDGIFITDPTGVGIDVNPWGCAALGYTRDELAELSVTDLIPSEDLAAEPLRTPTASTDGLRSERRLRRKDGTLLDVEISSRMLEDGRMLGIVRDVSARKLAERELHRSAQALRESESRYETLARVSPVGIFRTDADGLCTYVNDRLCEITGLDAEQALGWGWSTRVHEDDYEMATREWRSAVGSRGRFDVEIRFRDRDGTVRWTLAQSEPVLKSGTPIGFVGTLTDITGQKASEANLALRAKQQAALASLSRDALSGTSVDRLLDSAVSLLAETLDVPLCSVLEYHPHDHALSLRAGFGWHPDRVGRSVEPAETSSPPGLTLVSDGPVIVRDLRRDTRFTPSGLLDDHGVTDGVSVVIGGRAGPFGVLGAYAPTRRSFSSDAVDFLQAAANVLATAIEREVTEAALERTQRHLRTVVSNAPIMLWATDPECRITFCQGRGLTALGLSADTMIGRPVQDFDRNHPEISAGCRRAVTGQGVSETWDMGDLVWDVRCLPHRGPGADPSGMIGLAIDVTDRMRAEQALRRSEESFRSLFENAIYGIYRAKGSGEFLAVNPALARMLGYDSPAALAGASTVSLYVDPSDRDRLVEQYAHMSHITGAEAFWRRRDGKTIQVRLSGRPVYDDEGGVEYYEMMVEDVTDQRAIERQLRHAQKMESLGTLAGGVAHDFNNILLAILGASELGREETDPAAPVHRRLDLITDAAQRAEGLVSQILAFSRQQEPTRVSVDLRDVCKEAFALLRATLPSTIELTQQLELPSGRVHGDPNQMLQILLNLGTNAAHAMPKGGQMGVGLRAVDLDATAARRYGGVVPGPHIELTVSDTGAGMDPETLERIFDPFFTTKEIGEGTGLGLAAVHGIVQAHEGGIDVASRVGEGTTFSLVFPQMETSEPSVSPTSTERAIGDERILVVDDEEQIANLVRQQLVRYGYDVTAISDSLGALALVRAQPQRFDVLVTDHTMPRLTGLELARQVRRVAPDLTIILTTGFSTDVTSERTADAGINKLVMKPYTGTQLAAHIRDALGQSG